MNIYKLSSNFVIKLILVFFIVSIYSCQKDKLKLEIIHDSAFIQNLYNNASDSLLIDNQNLILETELYRDFFPGGPYINGLLAPIYIVNTDSAAITNNYSLNNLFVISNNQVWVSKPEIRDDAYSPIFKNFYFSSDGPEWEPGIYVDVIVSITDFTNKNEKLLIARNQIIHRVE